LSERGLRTLCDYLVAIEFLTKLGAKYALMPISAAFLDRKSPAYAALGSPSSCTTTRCQAASVT
jgi:hypothetical protein